MKPRVVVPVYEPVRESSKGLRMMEAFRKWVLILTSVIAGIGQLHGQAPEMSTGPSSTSHPDQTDLAIGPGDLLDLSVYHVPELILKVRVETNGTVSLPLLGDIKLAGLSIRDAEKLIASSLIQHQFVLQPEVSVFVEESAALGITVYGEVATPGRYQLRGPRKLYDVLSEAGSITSKAGRKVTIIHAAPTGSVEVLDLPNADSPPSVNVSVFNGDTIIVSKAGLVYVLGEVNKPGAFLVENNTSLSILKSIALAQGTTRVASLKHTVILRSSPKGSLLTEIPLDKILRAKAPDLQLKAEDIVFVPLSNIKSYGAMGIQGAIQAAVYTAYAAETR
jgi:polysaccharide biosynthesis/export protein